MECLPSMSIVESHYHILIQAVIQLVCWRYIFNLTRQYVTNNCTNKQWFRRWSSKPNGMGGENGDESVIEMCVMMTSHSFSGFFIGLAYYLQNPQLFVIGALCEFAYETIDMVRAFKKHLDGKGKHWIGLFFRIIHHQAAFTAILPACLYYADNKEVHQIAWGLLGSTTMTVALSGFYSSRDVYNLQERGQYTVSYLIMTLLWLYFRWYITILGMYAFLTGDEFGGLSFGFKAMLILFCVGVKLLDVILTRGLLNQLYQWLFTPKCMERPTKITRASLMKPCSMPVQLIRMQSNPLF